MAENEVIDRDAEQPVVPQGQGKDENVTITRAELASLNRRLEESEKSERDWAAFHRNGAPRNAAAPVEEEEEDASEFLDDSVNDDGVEGDTPEKLVDEFAAEGVAALKKRGFITAKDAQKLAADTAVRVARELIGRERQKSASDTTIMGEFPELKDQNSELFKATAKIYQKAVAMDPGATKTPVALYLAAQAAKAGLRTSRKAADDGDGEAEEDRRERANAQDFRSRGRGTVDDDDGDMMGADAKAVAKAMGLSNEEFQASKKELVSQGRGRKR